ncbi:MAG: hypothetical protein IJ217_01550 [Clostridia bacterium]|nr:hypothetical protein [Clostridia bacterium]
MISKKCRKNDYKKTEFNEERIINCIVKAHQKIIRDEEDKSAENNKKMKPLIELLQSFLWWLMYVLMFVFIIMAIVGGILLYNNLKAYGLLNMKNITFGGIIIIAIIFCIYTCRAHKHIDDIENISDISSVSALIISIFALIIALGAFALQFSDYNKEMTEKDGETVEIEAIDGLSEK